MQVYFFRSKTKIQYNTIATKTFILRRKKLFQVKDCHYPAYLPTSENTSRHIHVAGVHYLTKTSELFQTPNKLLPVIILLLMLLTLLSMNYTTVPLKCMFPSERLFLNREDD